MSNGSQPSKIAYEIALWRLQEQLSYSSTLDNRLATSFALAAAMVTLLGSALLFSDASDRAGISEAVVVAAGIFVANVVVATSALLLGRWALAPSLDQLLIHSQSAGAEELAYWTAEAIASAVEENGRQLRLKSQLVNLAIVLTGSTSIAVAIAACFLVQ